MHSQDRTGRCGNSNTWGWLFKGDTDETVFWVSQSPRGAVRRSNVGQLHGGDVSHKNQPTRPCEWAEPRVLSGLGLRSETDTGGCCQRSLPV